MNESHSFPSSLLGILNLHVLDFDKKTEQVIYLSQVRYKKKIIYFNEKPLKIKIKKEKNYFYISEGIFGLNIKNKSCEIALINFQKKFYQTYFDNKIKL